MKTLSNQLKETKHQQQLIDFDNINQTMILYSSIPDNFIEKLLKSAVDNKLLYLPNSIPAQIVYKFPDLIFSKNSIAFDHQLFLKKFVKRKRNSSIVSRKYIEEVMPMFNYNKKLSSEVSPQLLTRLSNRLKEKTVWIKSFKADQLNSEISKVVVPISFRLYNAIMPMFSLVNLKVNDHRMHLIDQVVENLLKIEISEEYKSEMKARENAVKYLKDLKVKINATKENNDYNLLFNSVMHYHKIFSTSEK
jgi:hypothetical protein